MSNYAPVIDELGEVEELTLDMMQQFKPAKDVLSATLYANLTQHKAPELQVDIDILAAFQATGQGWQTRINDVLRKYVAENSLN
jgi:uncharacterized protein (DUF4415 family)